MAEMFENVFLKEETRLDQVWMRKVLINIRCNVLYIELLWCKSTCDSTTWKTVCYPTLVGQTVIQDALNAFQTHVPKYSDSTPNW